MTFRWSLLAFAASPVSALLLSGCPRLICNREADLSTDGRYRVTIVEVYDPQTTFKYYEGLAPQRAEIAACPANLRPSAGTTLDLQAMGEVQPWHSCPQVHSDLAAASRDVAVIGPSTDATAASIAQGIRSYAEANALVAVDTVTIGGCTGTVALSVIPAGGPGAFLAAPVPAQPPPAVLYWFFASLGTGCTPCQVNLAVQVEKLQ